MNYFIETYLQNSVVFICQIIWTILLLLIQYNCREIETGNKILKVWLFILTIVINLFPYIGILFDFIDTCITIYFMLISKTMGNTYAWRFRNNSKLISFLMKDI